MSLETLGAEVDAQPVEVAMVASESIRVWSGVRDLACPDLCLGSARRVGRWAFGIVVGDLRHEPGDIPAGLFTRGDDHSLEFLVVLVGRHANIGFALVPEDRPKAMRAELL